MKWIDRLPVFPVAITLAISILAIVISVIAIVRS